MTNESYELSDPELFDRDTLEGHESDFKYKCNFLTRWHKVDETDPFKWVLDKTRLNEKEIKSIAYSIFALDKIIENDLKTIFHSNPEDYKKITLPMTEGTLAFMHGQISMNGKVRDDLKESIMAPDLSAKEINEEEKPTMKEKILGK